MYKFSAPMPYSKQDIDKILAINNEVENTKITSLYFALPAQCELYTGFESSRLNHEVTMFEYWKELMLYSIDKGFDFIYLLNSPLLVNSELLYDSLKKLDILINELRKIGINKLRIANPQLLEYIHEKYPDFYLYISTSFHFQTIKHYENFIEYHPYIKQIVFSTDNNKNFELLKNLIKKYTDIEFELLVNEGCIISCPHRYFHDRINNKLNNSDYQIFNRDYYNRNCRLGLPLFQYLCLSNLIYPWEIKEYFKIGINYFKFAGRDTKDFKLGKTLEYYKLYLQGIDNYGDIKEKSISLFYNYIPNKNRTDIPIKELKQYLPNINHFKKFGKLCAVKCQVNCFYCNDCAKKLEKVFIKVNKNKTKEQLYVSACTI